MAETGLPAEVRRNSWTPWPRGQANPAPGPGPRTCTTHGGPVPTDRRRLIFRGNAANTNCSPRYLNANNRPSNANVNIGCSAQGWISFSVELWAVPVPERGAHPRQGPGGKCRMGGRPVTPGTLPGPGREYHHRGRGSVPVFYFLTLLFGNEMLSRVQ